MPARSRYDTLSLTEAVQLGFMEDVELCIKEGCNLDGYDEDGDTACMHAAALPKIVDENLHSFDFLKVLLEAGLCIVSQSD